MSLYTGDMLEDFLEQPKCGHWGGEAKNRCSKWKHEWYCSRECQIKAWKGHKKLWQLLAQSISEDQRTKDKLKKEEAEKKKKEESKVLVQEIKQETPSNPKKSNWWPFCISSYF